ncbi:kelch motif-containing protein [Pseudonocardia sp. RS11V-5]|uniref:kelch motif-containing protein n=1 Tax=Pseudonocardia terrae TaxID=2905831 RepID=UPI001E4509E0|nr:kelch motif-containing protein [Pseudonocardia terrae]MCE3555734.1 kelch motif-containing protein [Pseudonocardia terrae]
MKRALRAVLRGLVRHRKLATLVTVPGVLLAVNVPPALAFVSDYQHDKLINSAEYKAQYGKWDVIDLPSDLRVNAIHAALLPTGKLLIVAGSGNDQTQFDAGTFKSLVYDPATGQGRIVLTPDDMFCGGHAFLSDGKLLVAGGTQRYEILDGAVTKAAGQLVVKNENPDAGRDFPKGTEFRAPDGRRYLATNAFSVKPATKTPIDRRGNVRVTASETQVWVESTDTGTAGVTDTPTQYSITGLTGPDADNVYGLGQKMTMDKQDYQGIEQSYEFDPFTEEYVRVGDMNHKRWYPTLTGLPDGTVLTTSGLDGSGVILPGQNEIFDPKTKTWTERPDLFRYFPTYPAIFQTAKEGTLFYTGSNAGYGPADQGRIPGFWNLGDNSFRPVAGLRDADQMETSGSAWAGPVQDQKMIVVGGGGVGESPLTSKRIDVIDLKKGPRAAYTPGPDLPVPTRYPNVVQLPDDSLLIANGSRDYRGKGASDNLVASLYHPDTNTLAAAADPFVGRDYHSEGILLPTGQVMTLGGNSLFKDAADTKTAPFEQRLEIYTPPYLFHGPQPTITAGPDTATLGSTITVSSPEAGQIAKARLIRPSAATHATDVEQRTVALDVTKNPDGTLDLAIPAQPTLVPPGYYMLFLVDGAGTPSKAHWVHVT